MVRVVLIPRRRYSPWRRDLARRALPDVHPSNLAEGRPDEAPRRTELVDDRDAASTLTALARGEQRRQAGRAVDGRPGESAAFVLGPGDGRGAGVQDGVGHEFADHQERIVGESGGDPVVPAVRGKRVPGRGGTGRIGG